MDDAVLSSLPPAYKTQLDTSASIFLADVELPDTPLPTAELETLTSTTKKAMRITLMSAVCWALQSNQDLKVQKLAPEISNTGIEAAKSEFDTTLNAGINTSARHSSTLGPRSKDSSSSSTVREGDFASRSTDANISLSGRLPSGTNYSLGYSASRGTSSDTRPFYNSALNLNITQNLLKGAGADVNLVQVWTAQNTFVISLYQLQQVLIDLVTNVQSTYWDVYLALQTLQIRLEAYNVAKEQRQRTAAYVDAGKSTVLDDITARAEESARIGDVITAAALLKEVNLRFLRLLNPDKLPKKWNSLVYPSEIPILPTEELLPEQHVKLAKTYRPDLRQAELDMANGELEVVSTRNGLLPALDFVTDLGLAGVGDSLSDSNREVRHGEFPNWSVGLQFSYPLQNRAARSSFRRANFQVSQAQESINNFVQIIQVDIRTAVFEIERTGRLIDSTQVTSKLRQAQLIAEIEKFRVGRSTQLLVAQAERDLTTAKLDEVTAVVANIKAYLQLYKSEGTSLQRCGIEPIKITAASGVPHP